MSEFTSVPRTECATLRGAGFDRRSPSPHTLRMVSRFRAFRLHRTDRGVVARFESLSLDDLSPGNVVIKVRYSSINYKDALAATGTAPILRHFPLVGGIDLAGVVIESEDPRHRVGDRVLVTGCGLSETHDGGYAEVARVNGDWVVPLPAGMDERSAMALGTAGFSAALVLHRLEHNGQHPGLGPIVVTGATGGVGSVAIDLLAGRGYEVIAVTGKPEAEHYLRSLGAARHLLRRELDLASRPLETATFGGAVDNVGGELLAWLLARVRPWGSVASVGLVASSQLSTTVMPLILRGVSLLGISAAAAPEPLRRMLWSRLGGDYRVRNLDRIAARVIPFEDLPAAFPATLQGAVIGRVVVEIAPCWKTRRSGDHA